MLRLASTVKSVYPLPPAHSSSAGRRLFSVILTVSENWTTAATHFCLWTSAALEISYFVLDTDLSEGRLAPAYEMFNLSR